MRATVEQSGRNDHTAHANPTCPRRSGRAALERVATAGRFDARICEWCVGQNGVGGGDD